MGGRGSCRAEMTVNDDWRLAIGERRMASSEWRMANNSLDGWVTARPQNFGTTEVVPSKFPPNESGAQKSVIKPLNLSQNLPKTFRVLGKK